MAEDLLLSVLEKSNSEDLDPLVNYILNAEISENLSSNENYKNSKPDHTKYVKVIAEEILLFGGNSIANLFRGEGVEYSEIVTDVARKIKVKDFDGKKTQEVEMMIIMKILEESFEKMSDKEKSEIIQAFKEAGAKNLDFSTGFPSAAIITQVGIKMTGFLPYRMAVIVANAIAKAILGHGLRLATNAAITRAIGIFAGPIGWIITGLWTAIDIAGPAYRVTIPSVCHVAYLRQKLAHKEEFNV